MKIPILLPNIFNHPFTYKSSNLNLKLGDYVEVPFGKNKKIGIVWDEFEKNKNKQYLTKNVIRKLEIPSLNLETINFLKWFSEYNMVPMGMSLKLHLLSNEAIEIQNNEELQKYNTYKKANEITLSKEQLTSVKAITKNDNKFRVHVIQGTTGSGKTIVYFNSLKKKIKEGLQGLILLPEIGLTGEFQKKFKEFFGFDAAIWHSSVTKKNKKIIWNGIATGKIKVLIGARSSLFLPFSNLGIIVVDEEHDQSYKQDEGIIYNARDMAISRAFFANIPINLVTAVPSIETFDNIKKGKYLHSRLYKRYLDANLPNHEIINLNKSNLKNNSWISDKTIQKVKDHLNINDQVLFFVNRRGFAPYVLCKKCLKVHTCPNCSINLVYHKKKENLICHYCGYTTKLNRKCNDNKNCEYAFSGPGVERIYDEVKKIFPGKEITIFSSDTMNKKSSSEILEKIKNNKIQILIGTQLISKGFHFPNLNCIVVVDIDLTLHGHDLRAAEKNLQLYHQLSGRAGRAGKPATVYFQTYNIKSNAISQITNVNPDIFLEKELLLRKRNNLPPFERFISIILSGKNEKKIELFAHKLKEKLDNSLNAKILGPVVAPIFKINKNFRYRILVRSKKTQKIQKTLSNVLKNFKNQKEIKLAVDVDPISFN
ncbi:MAG: primosomal protein N' [Sphingomonadaceae bacterium]|nr:primosomal protein N' [Sphingomonadaceae bacterium]